VRLARFQTKGSLRASSTVSSLIFLKLSHFEKMAVSGYDRVCVSITGCLNNHVIFRVFFDNFELFLRIGSNRVNFSLKEFLGHANLDNTLLNIQVEQAIFGLNSDDEYNATATNNKDEIKALLSVGFEYMCQKDDTLFFRKRK